jgi:serine/threonine-protein kinase
LSNLSELDANEGRCAEAEADSRRAIAIDPSSPWAFDHLARAILGRGGSLASARAVTEQGFLANKFTAESSTALSSSCAFHVLKGDFASATTDVGKWQLAIATSLDENDHLAAMQFEMLTRLELGDNDGAAAAAKRFLTRREAWIPDSYYDYEIVALAMVYRAGQITRAEFVAKRDAWLQRQEQRPTLVGIRGARWIDAYAVPAMSPDDAQDALGALPQYAPLPDPLTSTTHYDLAVGTVYLLADRSDEARTYLRRAARSCSALFYPIEHTVANLRFAEISEKVGDRSDACASYALVLERWGSEPRSRSAMTARHRYENLRCAVHAIK